MLNPEEAISEAQIRRIIIRGLKAEYIPYVTSIQEWVQQPSLEEFENLLSSQESLAKQMTNVSIKEGKKSFKSKENQNSLASRPHSQRNSSPSRISGESSKKIFKCHRCGKMGHVKRFCRAKLQESNVADKIVEEEDSGKCFVTETKYVDALASINFENDLDGGF